MFFLALTILIPCGIWSIFLLWRIHPIVLAGLTFSVGIVLGPEFFTAKVGPLPITIDRLLWGGLVILLGYTWLSRRDGKTPKLSAIDFCLFVFLLLAGFSMATHDWTINDNAPFSRYLFFQLVPTSFFWIGRHCEFEQKHIRQFAWIMTIFGVYLSATALFEKFGIYELVYPKYIINNEVTEFFGRARGPFINPVGCGIAQIGCLGCLFFLWKNSGERGRVVFSGLAALMFAGIFCTMTRSVWLSCAAATSMMVWFAFPKAARGAMISGAAVAGLIVILFLSPYLNKFKRDRDVTAGQMAQSVKLRPILIAVAVKMASDRPLQGHGYGQYRKSAQEYYRNMSEDLPFQSIRRYHQHNIFLAYLTELGLMGMTLGLAIFGCFITRAGQIVTNRRLPADFRFLGIMASMVTLAMLINGLFHDVSLIVFIGSIFFFLNGMVYAVADAAEADELMAEPMQPNESVPAAS